MRRKRNQIKVVEVLEEATKYDRAKIKILPITRLGLVEMTRERRRESLLSLLSEPCAECAGSGNVLSRESMYLRVQKEIHELTQGRTEGRLKVTLAPGVGDFVRERQDRLEKSSTGRWKSTSTAPWPGKTTASFWNSGSSPSRRVFQ
ncbi:MAG: ribonuclease E/G [Elusimicrobia bacterium]|nr:ribonuclease E/G [Elusimicrobiota bacterium]